MHASMPTDFPCARHLNVAEAVHDIACGTEKVVILRNRAEKDPIGEEHGIPAWASGPRSGNLSLTSFLWPAMSDGKLWN
jgi:hypothetical protein